MRRSVAAKKPRPCAQRFTATLGKQGYRLLEKAELAAFQEVEPKRGERRADTRKNGETELLVSFEADSYVGDPTYRSGVRFRWFARRPYRAPQPKLGEALAALPGWMKVKYLDEKFFTLLADEPIAWLGSGRNLSIKFARPAADKLVGGWNRLGFEYRNEDSFPDGSAENVVSILRYHPREFEDFGRWQEPVFWLRGAAKQERADQDQAAAAASQPKGAA